VYVLAAFAVRADVRDCVCNLDSPSITETRGCSLCLEAEKQSSGAPVFALHDNDPAKPNRWLILTRAHVDGPNPLTKMSAGDRLAFWDAAIAKGKEVWGGDWAVAMNGDIARRQCHFHAHVGKLLDGKESDAGFFVDGAADLPVLTDGTGFWFHPSGARLHVHEGEQNNEAVLLK